MKKTHEKKKSLTYLITGGAGFIGSNIAKALSLQGERVIICDRFRLENKWHNLTGLAIYDIIPPEELTAWIKTNAKNIDGIIHMGAISATTERDVDKIIKNNFLLSIELWHAAAKYGLPFIYASSAATYGNGDNGFDDTQTPEALSRLLPLNPYGWSKLIFDQRVISDVLANNSLPPQWAGLKFFNVYGPNEHHKGDMSSIINKAFPLVSNNQPISLFKSHNPNYQNGGQLRDFVYVNDCTKIITWLLKTPSVSGIFNVGTGQPRSFNELIHILAENLGKNPNIHYIDTPAQIRDNYQYYTKANINKLRRAGYEGRFYTLEEGIKDYITCDLNKI